MEGEVEPTDEEVKAGEHLTQKDDPEAKPLSELGDSTNTNDIKGIPEFWLTALRNHINISELITERDEEALRSLTDIGLTYLTDKPGYTITFRFKPNEFFSNEVLTKTYYQKEELSYEGDWVYSHAEGTKIDWKSDKDLTKTVEVRKQRNKHTNRTRVVKKIKKTDSFFDFFTPPVPPTEDQIESGDFDVEEAEELESKLEVDFEIAEDFKERLIPRAIDYFTGRAMEYDMDYAGEDVDDDEEDEEDDEEDDSESDDEPVVRKPKGISKVAAKEGEKDCKNQ